MIDPVAFYIFGKEVRWYGILIAAAVLLGIYLAVREAKRLGYDPDLFIDFCLWVIPISIVGARIYYVIFQWDYYSAHPSEIIAIWHGGIAIYGAVLAGILVGIIFAKLRKVDFWSLADIVAPSLILGQAIGRWGNFFNGEAYGYLVSSPKWQWFPAAVYIDGQWHMATFFYESMWDLAVFIFLMWYRKRKKYSGDVFLGYLALYGVGRFVVEGLRMDSLMWGPLRVSQILSLILIAVAVLIRVYWMRTGKQPFLMESAALQANANDEDDVGDL
jgi:phosphatidylglycerol:prolipoprotein diacylglycerol transferase